MVPAGLCDHARRCRDPVRRDRGDRRTSTSPHDGSSSRPRDPRGTLGRARPGRVDRRHDHVRTRADDAARRRRDRPRRAFRFVRPGGRGARRPVRARRTRCVRVDPGSRQPHRRQLGRPTHRRCRSHPVGGRRRRARPEGRRPDRPREPPRWRGPGRDRAHRHLAPGPDRPVLARGTTRTRRDDDDGSLHDARSVRHRSRGPAGPRGGAVRRARMAGHPGPRAAGDGPGWRITRTHRQPGRTSRGRDRRTSAAGHDRPARDIGRRRTIDPGQPQRDHAVDHPVRGPGGLCDRARRRDAPRAEAHGSRPHALPGRVHRAPGVHGPHGIGHPRHPGRHRGHPAGRPDRLHPRQHRAARRQRHRQRRHDHFDRRRRDDRGRHRERHHADRPDPALCPEPIRRARSGRPALRSVRGAAPRPGRRPRRRGHHRVLAAPHLRRPDHDQRSRRTRRRPAPRGGSGDRITRRSGAGDPHRPAPGAAGRTPAGTAARSGPPVDRPADRSSTVALHPDGPAPHAGGLTRHVRHVVCGDLGAIAGRPGRLSCRRRPAGRGRCLPVDTVLGGRAFDRIGGWRDRRDQRGARDDRCRPRGDRRRPGLDRSGRRGPHPDIPARRGGPSHPGHARRSFGCPTGDGRRAHPRRSAAARDRP